MSAAAEHHGPLDQFAIQRIVEIDLGGFDASFTNSAMMMVMSSESTAARERKRQRHIVRLRVSTAVVRIKDHLSASVRTRARGLGFLCLAWRSAPNSPF